MKHTLILILTGVLHALHTNISMSIRSTSTMIGPVLLTQAGQ